MSQLTIDELPEILTARHISEHLHLSVEQVYNLFRRSPKTGGIPSFAIGKSKRAKKGDYLKWLDSKNGKE